MATSATALDASGSAYSVTATYSGDANFAGSASGAHDLTVQQAGTTSGLLLSASSVAFGIRVDRDLQRHGHAAVHGHPDGHRHHRHPHGDPVHHHAAGDLVHHNGRGARPRPAPYTVTASYAGDTNFIGIDLGHE